MISPHKILPMFSILLDKFNQFEWCHHRGEHLALSYSPLITEGAPSSNIPIVVPQSTLPDNYMDY